MSSFPRRYYLAPTCRARASRKNFPSSRYFQILLFFFLPHRSIWLDVYVIGILICFSNVNFFFFSYLILRHAAGMDLEKVFSWIFFFWKWIDWEFYVIWVARFRGFIFSFVMEKGTLSCQSKISRKTLKRSKWSFVRFVFL